MLTLRIYSLLLKKVIVIEIETYINIYLKTIIKHLFVRTKFYQGPPFSVSLGSSLQEQHPSNYLIKLTILHVFFKRMKKF